MELVQIGTTVDRSRFFNPDPPTRLVSSVCQRATSLQGLLLHLACPQRQDCLEHLLLRWRQEFPQYREFLVCLGFQQRLEYRVCQLHQLRRECRVPRVCLQHRGFQEPRIFLLFLQGQRHPGYREHRVRLTLQLQVVLALLPLSAPEEHLW